MASRSRTIISDVSRATTRRNFCESRRKLTSDAREARILVHHLSQLRSSRGDTTIRLQRPRDQSLPKLRLWRKTLDDSWLLPYHLLEQSVLHRHHFRQRWRTMQR